MNKGRPSRPVVAAFQDNEGIVFSTCFLPRFFKIPSEIFLSSCIVHALIIFSRGRGESDPSWHGTYFIDAAAAKFFLNNVADKCCFCPNRLRFYEPLCISLPSVQQKKEVRVLKFCGDRDARVHASAIGFYSDFLIRLVHF